MPQRFAGGVRDDFEIAVPVDVGLFDLAQIGQAQDGLLQDAEPA